MPDRRFSGPPPMEQRPPPDHRPPPGGKYIGHVHSYDQHKGFGFLRSPDIEGDVYFPRAILPPDVQSRGRTVVLNRQVEFEVGVAPHDGKSLRAVKMWFLDKVLPRERDRRDTNGVDLPALEEHVVEDMKRLLTEHGGTMDYGRFSNAFSGIKKQQLQDQFALIQESANS